MGVALRPVSDLGGLPVSDAGGRPIGRLFGSLAEADSGLIRYLDLSLDDAQRHVLVPIGHARVRDGSRPRVRLRAAVRDDLERIPSWAGALEDDYERDVIAAYGRSLYGHAYYAHPAYDHSRLYAGEHPIVRKPEPEPPQPAPPQPAKVAPHLALLSRRSDYEVATGEPDIGGWALMTDADLPSGTIVDLVIDIDEECVRYVIVEVTDGGGRVLLPVGFLELDEPDHSVYAPGLRHDDLADLPRYTEEEIVADFEALIYDTLQSRLLDRRRYALPDFRDGRVTDRRRS